MNVGELLSEPNQRTVADELEEFISSLSINPTAIAVAALIDPNELWLKNRNTINTRYWVNSHALDIISAPASEAYAERGFSYCGILTIQAAATELLKTSWIDALSWG